MVRGDWKLIRVRVYFIVDCFLSCIVLIVNCNDSNDYGEYLLNDWYVVVIVLSVLRILCYLIFTLNEVGFIIILLYRWEKWDLVRFVDLV